MRVRAGPSLLGAASGDDKADDNGESARDRHDPQARRPNCGRPRSVAEAPPPEKKIERRVQRTDAQSEEEPRREEEPAGPAPVPAARQASRAQRGDAGGGRHQPYPIGWRRREER